MCRPSQTPHQTLFPGPELALEKDDALVPGESRNVPLSLNLDVVGQLASFNDPDSYVGGGFTPGWFNQAKQVLGEKPDRYSDTPFGKQEWFQLQGVTINLRILQLLSDVCLADESTYGQL